MSSTVAVSNEDSRKTESEKKFASFTAGAEEQFFWP